MQVHLLPSQFNFRCNSVEFNSNPVHPSPIARQQHLALLSWHQQAASKARQSLTSSRSAVCLSISAPCISPHLFELPGTITLPTQASRVPTPCLDRELLQPFKLCIRREFSCPAVYHSTSSAKSSGMRSYLQPVCACGGKGILWVKLRGALEIQAPASYLLPTVCHSAPFYYSATRVWSALKRIYCFYWIRLTPPFKWIKLG